MFPVIRDGLESFAQVVATVKRDGKKQPLRITTTNAFASRWLVPRLPLWRRQRGVLPLEVIGTDAVLDLQSGDVDVAIRNAATRPTDGVVNELFRDSFWPVCSPRLLARPLRRATELRGHVLIHFHWPPFVPRAATWQRWLSAAQRRWRDVPDLSEMDHLNFREELHAIDAVLAGQGIGMISDLLVGDELKTGALIRAIDLKLSGFGFYLVRSSGHPREREIGSLSTWLQSAK